MSFGGYRHSYLWSIYVGVKLLDQRVGFYVTSFSKLYHFTLQPAMYASSCFSTFLPLLRVVNPFHSRHSTDVKGHLPEIG